MDIVIIGSGNVASVLGRKLTAAGHKIVQVISRNAAEASKLAYEWDTESSNYLSVINRSADVYLIAVPDHAIATIAIDIRLPGKVVAHTAASVPGSVLADVTDLYGVFYPLQSLRKEVAALPDIPIYFDAKHETAKRVLGQLADSISFEMAVVASDEERVKLHLAAVFANNFVNHLYALTAEYCKAEGIDFRQLLPIIEETALRLRSVSPLDSQTGPAIRHDRETLQKHLALLSEHPRLKNVYLLLTESIQQEKAG